MLLLLVALATTPPIEHRAPPPRVACRSSRVLPALGRPRGGPFSADSTGALRLEVTVTGELTAGPHEIEFRVFTPGGDLYQSLRAPVPGRGRRGRNTFVTLQVAGTAISQSALLGRWKFTTHLDGSAERCGLERSFVLRR